MSNKRFLGPPVGGFSRVCKNLSDSLDQYTKFLFDNNGVTSTFVFLLIFILFFFLLQIISQECMNAMDSCFKLCTAEKEEKVLKIFFRNATEYRKQTQDQAKILQQSIIAFCNLDIFQKDITNYIVALLMKDICRYYDDRLFIFRKCAQTCQRVGSYLCRFYLPNKCNEGAKYSDYIPYERTIFDMMCGDYINSIQQIKKLK